MVALMTVPLVVTFWAVPVVLLGSTSALPGGGGGGVPPQAEPTLMPAKAFHTACSSAEPAP